MPVGRHALEVKNLSYLLLADSRQQRLATELYAWAKEQDKGSQTQDPIFFQWSPGTAVDFERNVFHAIGKAIAPEPAKVTAHGVQHWSHGTGLIIIPQKSPSGRSTDFSKGERRNTTTMSDTRDALYHTQTCRTTDET